MKKLLTLLLATLIASVGLFGVVACKKNNDDATTEVKRMTIDINPSVEFILDAENKVVSVTGLNDDGDLLISGEIIVGKTAEEASEFVVKLATDAGFIVEGDEENAVSISISGKEKEVEELYNKVKNKVNAFLNSEGVTATLKKVEAVKIDVLKEMVAKCYPELTAEEINAKTEEELLDLLKLSRIECQELKSEALRESYYKAKNYHFNLASYEKTLEIIEGLGEEYQELVTLYQNAIVKYQEAITAIETAQYNYFVDPESDYQKALNSLHDKKAEILDLKKQISEASSIDAISLKIDLAQKEVEYEALKTGLETAKELADVAVEALITALKTAEQALINIANELPAEIETVLGEKAGQIDEAVNKAKDEAFEKFEQKFKDDITKHEEDLKKRKEDLINKHKDKEPKN